MKKELEDLLGLKSKQDLELEFSKLSNFIDAAINQALNADSKERVSIFLNNFLNMKNYLMTTTTIQKTKLEIKDEVIGLFDNFVKDHELDLEKLTEIRNKKKERELEEGQLSLESLSEKDLSTSSSEEEN